MSTTAADVSEASASTRASIDAALARLREMVPTPPPTAPVSRTSRAADKGLSDEQKMMVEAIQKATQAAKDATSAGTATGRASTTAAAHAAVTKAEGAARPVPLSPTPKDNTSWWARHAGDARQASPTNAPTTRGTFKRRPLYNVSSTSISRGTEAENRVDGVSVEVHTDKVATKAGDVARLAPPAPVVAAHEVEDEPVIAAPAGTPAGPGISVDVDGWESVVVDASGAVVVSPLADASPPASAVSFAMPSPGPAAAPPSADKEDAATSAALADWIRDLEEENASLKRNQASLMEALCGARTEVTRLQHQAAAAKEAAAKAAVKAAKATALANSNSNNGGGGGGESTGPSSPGTGSFMTSSFASIANQMEIGELRAQLQSANAVITDTRNQLAAATAAREASVRAEHNIRAGFLDLKDAFAEARAQVAVKDDEIAALRAQLAEYRARRR